MYRQRNRFLFALLCIILLCSSAQATILQISVQDSIDNSTIPRATVFLNGDSFGRTNNYGQVFLNYSGLNDPLIRVSVSGYEDWENLVPKNETFILVNLSRKNLLLKINLFDSDSLGSVSGAQVNISAEHMKQTNLTDVSGSVSFRVNASTLYSIDITAPGYLPRSGTIDIGTENKNAQYWLLPANRFSFIVKENIGMVPVSDADVRINNTFAGKTDNLGVLTIPVVRGKVYSIDINKAGYQEFTESRLLTETDALLSVTLIKVPLGAFVSVFDENRDPIKDADVFINGTLSGTTNQFGRINFPNLVSGPYNIEVRKTGYIPVNRTILVTDKGEDYTVEMPFENADLTLFVQEKDQKMVPNATIIINDKIVGDTDDHGQYRTKVRFNTLYNITVIKDTYQPVSVQKLFPEGNATASLTLIMEKNLDLRLIILIVVGVICVLVVFGIIRKRGGRTKRRSDLKKDEI
jgi:hypothetical protein